MNKNAKRKAWLGMTIRERQKKQCILWYRGRRSYCMAAMLLASILTSCAAPSVQKEAVDTREEETTGERFVATFENIFVQTQGAFLSDVQLCGDNMLYCYGREGEDKYQTVIYGEKDLFSQAEETVYWRNVFGKEMPVLKASFCGIEGEKYLLINEDKAWQLVELNKDNRQVASWDVTDIIHSEKNEIAMYRGMADREGNIYLVDEIGFIVHIFDKKGIHQYSLPIERETVSDIVKTPNNEVYLVQQRYKEGGMQLVFRTIDAVRGKIKEKICYFMLTEGGERMWQIAGCYGEDILVWDEEGVWTVKMNSEKVLKLFAWSDSYINIEYVEIVQLFSPEADRVTVLLQDPNGGAIERAEVESVNENEVPKKEIITFGVLEQRPDNYSADIKRFNKKSMEYRIEIKKYTSEGSNSAEDTLYEDILSGKAPDFLEVSDFDIENLGKKDVLEDLSPYFEQSSVIKQEDILSNVWEDSLIEGKMVSIFPQFALYTVGVKRSIAGDKELYKIEDVMDWAKANPDSYILKNSTLFGLVNFFVFKDLDSFIDWEDGTCNFQSQKFLDRIEFIKNIKIMDNSFLIDKKEEEKAEMFQRGEILLFETYATNVSQLVYRKALLGEEISWMGYPDAEDSMNTKAGPSSLYAMNAASTKKDGVWAFFEFILSEEEQKRIATTYPCANGVPVHKEAVEIFLQSDREREKYSNNIYMNDVRKVTEEDISDFRRLLEGVKKETYAINNKEMKVYNIITEEVEAFMNDDKSAEKVAEIIQNRISLFLTE